MRAGLFLLGLFTVTLASGCVPPDLETRMTTPPAEEKGAVRRSFPFMGVKDTWLYAQLWRPEAEPRAVLVIVHGLKDHSDRYSDFAEGLTKLGFAVYAFDLPGHGRSAGPRVWIDKFDDYVDDVGSFVAEVKRREPNKPVFLMGHSMGGAIATLYALRAPKELAGVVLSAPALRASATGFEKAATRMIDVILPEAGVFQLPIEKFSRAPDVIRDCKADKLVYQGAAPAHTAVGLIDALDEIDRKMDTFDVPLLDMHGTKDEITMPEGSKALVDRARTKDKTLKLYDGLFHDLLHEPEHDQVEKDVSDWLVAHAPQ